MTTPTPRTDEAIEGMSFAWRNTAPIVELARQLERELAAAKSDFKECYADNQRILEELAAAQERIERLEACVNGEVPEGALKALGRWLAPVLDEDKWATAEKFLNAALLQLLEAQEALKAAEARAESNAKDAERLDAISKGLWFVEPDYALNIWRVGKASPGGVPSHKGKTLRAAIDAAMKEPK